MHSLKDRIDTGNLGTLVLSLLERRRNLRQPPANIMQTYPTSHEQPASAVKEAIQKVR